MTKHGIAAPKRTGQTRLPDGRRLGWAEWGSENGQPVLFFSGAAMGRSLGFGADVVDRLRVRLIAVERPGLGSSDPQPGRTLNDWASDIAQFVEQRALGQPAVVGFSQGAPFALACAAAGAARAVAIGSGQDDLGYPAFADRLPPNVASLVQMVASDPDGVESSFAQSANPELMWNLVIGSSSEHDLAIYTEPSFEAAYRQSLQEGFSQGAAGYARDLVISLGRWPFDLGSIRIPVDLWYGGHDASTVHSPDHGTELSQRIPTARRHLLAEAGGSLLWTHSADILDSLLAAA